jgi:guanylate kinase
MAGGINMGKLFCLMGKSSVGKDSVFGLLCQDPELQLKPIIPYTTRPKRKNETDGVEYYFRDEEKLKEFSLQGKVIERRDYRTVKGIWSYFTLDDGQVDMSRGNYIFITTLEAYKKIKAYFEDENVVPIYLEIDDGVRLSRAIKREREQQNPNYDEMCRRFLADSIDFSKEKLDHNHINKYYNNFTLEECAAQIRKDLLEIIN